ncbi:MAG: DapH/DapD/GlmU-related protein [Oscillibacter sp.]
MRADGVERFFVVCDPRNESAVRACFPDGCDVTVSGEQRALLDFLQEDGPVTVLPCAMLPMEAAGESLAYTAQAAALRESWTRQVGGAIPGASPLSGFTAVPDLLRLQALELVCRDEIVRRHMANGVRFLDPSAVYIDPRVRIGRGTLILPGSILRGNTVIGTGCTIGPNAMVRSCTVGDDTEINASQVNESCFGSRTHVGPFAYVRPNCTIGDDIKVGDFVEVKNSTLGNGTKISHLTYVGDSDVGEKVNFGCGTVTTNYDGFKKYRCTIGSNSFIGCNTNLVAPVTVGEGAYIAAGATITQNVPPDALAVARARQENKEGWAARRRKLHGK